jgi:hypothetical protein
MVKLYHKKLLLKKWVASPENNLWYNIVILKI